MADKNAKSKAELDRLSALYLSTNNVDFFVEMMEAARPIIRHVFNKYNMSFVAWTYEDLFSEMYIEFKKLFDDGKFDRSRGNTSSYIFMVTNRAMANHLTFCQNNKNKILTEAVSDDLFDGEGNLSDFASQSIYYDDTLNGMINYEDKYRHIYYLSKRLSVFEILTLIFYLKGNNYARSAELIEEFIKTNKDLRTLLPDQLVNKKAVDNALVRVKVKAAELVDEGLFDE